MFNILVKATLATITAITVFSASRSIVADLRTVHHVAARQQAEISCYVDPRCSP